MRNVDGGKIIHKCTATQTKRPCLRTTVPYSRRSRHLRAASPAYSNSPRKLRVMKSTFVTSPRISEVKQTVTRVKINPSVFYYRASNATKMDSLKKYHKISEYGFSGKKKKDEQPNTVFISHLNAYEEDARPRKTGEVSFSETTTFQRRNHRLFMALQRRRRIHTTQRMTESSHG